MHSVNDVARYLLATQGAIPGERITNLKLQKLVYYAQGYHLALYGQPLFTESIKAWAHGPVVPSLWQEYRQYGSNPLPKPSKSPPVFTHEERELLDSVSQSYGQYAAWRLREVTHEERPWVEAYNRGGGSGTISHQVMAEFFKTRL